MIDRVVVKKILNSDDFVVLEGNRRICAAKIVYFEHLETGNIKDEVVSSIENIECLEYTGEEKDASWVFQGLRHIVGIKDWPPYNKAKLLVDQMDNEGLSLSQVGARFGLSPFGAGQWVRGYRAFKQAEEELNSSYELDINSYPYFQEIFGRSCISLREWLEWDNNAMCFNNTLNLEEFISWL